MLILPEFSSPIGDLNVVGAEPLEVFVELPEGEFGDETDVFLADFEGRRGDPDALFLCFCILEEIPEP